MISSRRSAGKTNLKKSTSYIGNRNSDNKSRRSENLRKLSEVYRDSPNKLAEIYEFDSIGKIAEVYDGKEFFAQTTILGTDEKAPPSYVNERKLFAEFNEILKMRQLYPQINYLGSYEREGKPTHLIEAVSDDSAKIIFAFEVETNLLVYRSGNYGDIKFGDYRKVGKILFPFYQSAFRCV